MDCRAERRSLLNDDRTADTLDTPNSYPAFVGSRVGWRAGWLTGCRAADGRLYGSCYNEQNQANETESYFRSPFEQTINEFDPPNFTVSIGSSSHVVFALMSFPTPPCVLGSLSAFLLLLLLQGSYAYNEEDVALPLLLLTTAVSQRQQQQQQEYRKGIRFRRR